MSHDSAWSWSAHTLLGLTSIVCKNLPPKQTKQKPPPILLLKPHQPQIAKPAIPPSQSKSSVRKDRLPSRQGPLTAPSGGSSGAAS